MTPTEIRAAQYQATVDLTEHLSEQVTDYLNTYELTPFQFRLVLEAATKNVLRTL